MYTNTKGGWKYRKDISGKTFYIETVDMGHTKTFIGEIGGGLQTPKEIEDNAKLVSAAPEMFEALKRVEAFLVANEDVLAPFPTRSELDNIRAAMFKTGLYQYNG